MNSKICPDHEAGKASGQFTHDGLRGEPESKHGFMDDGNWKHLSDFPRRYRRRLTGIRRREDPPNISEQLLDRGRLNATELRRQSLKEWTRLPGVLLVDGNYGTFDFYWNEAIANHNCPVKTSVPSSAYVGLRAKIPGRSR